MAAESESEEGEAAKDAVEQTRGDGEQAEQDPNADEEGASDQDGRQEHAALAHVADPAEMSGNGGNQADQHRILFTMDGEDPQIKAILCDLVPIAKEKGIEVLKGPASTSKVTQANDVGVQHKVLKSTVEQIWMQRSASNGDAAYTEFLPDILGALEASSRTTYIRFLSHLPVILSKALTMKIIKDGWAKTGLWPLNQERILQQCSSWSSMSGEHAKRVISALPGITANAKLNGMTSTTLMQDLLGDIGGCPAPTEGPDAEQPGKKKKKLLEDKPLNYQRALWLNHEAVTKGRVEKEQAKIKEDEEKRRAAEERLKARQQAQKQREEAKQQREEAKQQQREEAKQQREEAKRKRDDDKHAAPPKATLVSKVRCSNAACDVAWEGSRDAANWLGCDGCNKWFCTKRECLQLMRKHEKICLK